ncbi:MAG: YdcF family protein [Clostridium sp.]
MKKKLCIMTGIILIIYVITINIISFTKIAFSVPVIIFSIAIILYGIKREQVLSYINEKVYLKKLFRIIKICFLCFLAGFIAIEGIIMGYPKHDTSDTDYILVLGAGLRNGNEPSTILRDRLNAAIYYIDTYGSTGKIVVSGGQGGDEKLPEAEAMKKYLMDNGISEDRILVENKSRNTNQNFEFSKEVIEADSNRPIEESRVKIITTDFHAFRSRFLAKRHNYNNITNYSSETVWYLIPISYLREAFAVVKSALFD